MSAGWNAAAWNKSREIVERVVVEGELILLTPTHFGNGEAGQWVDMPLALDPLEGRALITGASLAGALRNYLHERQNGYRARNQPGDLSRRLFGWQNPVEGGEETAAPHDDAAQSPLIVSDAIAEKHGVEVRDGVAIDHHTRTALVGEKDGEKFGFKYDLELLEAGARFPLRFELLLDAKEEKTLLQALALALQGLEQGEISLGARRRRGFGRCKVNAWRLRRYRLDTPAGLLAWLEDSRETEASGPEIAPLLGLNAGGLEKFDRRRRFTIEADFALASSLLIRSASGKPKSADTVHLRSARPDQAEDVPVISGTSLAGALRARAVRIAAAAGQPDPEGFVNALFGPRSNDPNQKAFRGPDRPGDGTPQEGARPKASRFWVQESVVSLPSGTKDPELIQDRVKINRFTGGAYETGLFNAQPLFPLSAAEGQDTQVTLVFQLENPNQAEIGLALLLLKDLWTGDLPLGGETGIGRGRLRGLSARLAYQQPGQKLETWELAAAGEDPAALQAVPEDLNPFVKALGGAHA